MALWPFCKYVQVLLCWLKLNEASGLGSIIFGYDLGVIAGVLPAPDFIVRLLSRNVIETTSPCLARHG